MGTKRVSARPRGKAEQPKIDTSGGADEDYDAQINALMDGSVPLSFGPSSSGAKSSSLSGGYTAHASSAAPSAKAMPTSSSRHRLQQLDHARLPREGKLIRCGRFRMS